MIYCFPRLIEELTHTFCFPEYIYILDVTEHCFNRYIKTPLYPLLNIPMDSKIPQIIRKSFIKEIIKKHSNIKVQSGVIDLLSECTTVSVSYISTICNAICNRKGKKAIGDEEVIEVLSKMDNEFILNMFEELRK
ncbi:hypothetical protein CWI39_0410p0030 [Hamiltosporidium magnivora]|uniref:Transcription factor CBF/NF-Y/archaeal histone domain-containing protein n=3 Tax=Hamiltosporidium TaxID=1176354 RepID=A0A4V2JW73_9MICR|nr:hypothetical protein CWI39_0410p0030 [Hamiltosporidium magnivora]